MYSQLQCAMSSSDIKLGTDNKRGSVINNFRQEQDMGMGLSPVPLALVKSLVPSNIIGHGKVPETSLKYMAHGIYPYEHLGYTLSDSRVRTNVLLYADDTCLVADGPANCQHLLSRVEQWLQWTGMVAKVPKCFTLSIQSSTAKRADPHLHLQGQAIPFITDKSIMLLGGPISVPSNK